MKTKSRLIAALSALMLALAILSGCGAQQSTPTATEAPSAAIGEAAEKIGEGQYLFTLEVTKTNGETKSFSVSTDETTVGGALVSLGLISGDDSAYGLYVKTVDGETLDYDRDGKYWAFYINGEYASTGVDQTEIVPGSVYAFVSE